MNQTVAYRSSMLESCIKSMGDLRNLFTMKLHLSMFQTPGWDSFRLVPIYPSSLVDDGYDLADLSDDVQLS